MPFQQSLPLPRTKVRCRLAEAVAARTAPRPPVPLTARTVGPPFLWLKKKNLDDRIGPGTKFFLTQVSVSQYNQHSFI